MKMNMFQPKHIIIMALLFGKLMVVGQKTMEGLLLTLFLIFLHI